VTLKNSYYDEVLNADGAAMTRRPSLKFVGTTVVDDPTEDVTTITVATDYATVDGHVISDESGTAFTQRPTLKISEATVADDSTGEATTVSIRTDYATVDGHGITDAVGTAYPQRGKLIFEGDGISAIVDEGENDATAITINSDGDPGDISSYVSNCVLKMPSNGVTLSGSSIVLKPGIEVLIPNGRNDDGTHKSIPFTLESQITSGGQFASVGYGVVLLKDDGTAVNRNINSYVISSEKPDGSFSGICYNPVTNIANEYSAGVLVRPFMGAPVADTTTAQATFQK
jgi:hypothetical protein